jgi:co-chaperonin GroES (HSP10)
LRCQAVFVTYKGAIVRFHETLYWLRIVPFQRVRTGGKTESSVLEQAQTIAGERIVGEMKKMIREVRVNGRTALVFAAGAMLMPVGLLTTGFWASAGAARAQATVVNRQIGTVKTVTPNKLTITTDAGVVSTVNVADEAKVLQIAPGSTNLKSAQTIALGDIEVGDRVLVTGHEDAPNAFTASRVILMKSTDIAQKNETQEADWQKRGTGGLVNAIDPATGTVTITARGSKIVVKTTPTTVYRRYAGDSVKFQDAVPGTFGQIQRGDQLRVRGAKSEDGIAGGPEEIAAEEIVSGAFRNLAGTIVSIDLAADKVTLKDLTTKKTYSIQLTANSSLRVLPPEVAARFAARARGGAAEGPGGAKPSAADSGAEPGVRPGSGHGAGAAGMDLSQMLSRLPQGSLQDLHAGDALMVVASQPQPGSVSLTAITLLSGVEPILAATPSGTPSMTLSPWNMSGPDGGGA